MSMVAEQVAVSELVHAVRALEDVVSKHEQALVGQDAIVMARGDVIAAIGGLIAACYDTRVSAMTVKRIWELVDEANMRADVTKQDLIDQVMPVLIAAGMPSREWTPPKE